MAKDFSTTRSILTRRPKINFVEPEQVPGDQVPEVPTETPILDKRVQVKDLVDQYKRVEQLSDLAQRRIDARAKNMKICLDPRKDANVIAALKRRFGNVAPCITYQQYKTCLEEIAKAGYNNVQQFVVSASDLSNARENPFKTDFSGYTTDNGTLRPEVQFDSPVEEIDQEKFQSDAVTKLFNMMLPMLQQMTDAKILQHLLTAPHS